MGDQPRALLTSLPGEREVRNASLRNASLRKAYAIVAEVPEKEA